MRVDAAIDEVTLGVLWNRLVAVADEAAAALFRASVSVIVGEVFDFSCAVTDRAGRSVVFPTKSMPLFNGSVEITTAALLEHIPLEALAEGDTLICNDPWIASGHLPDVFLASPIFVRGSVVGFAASIAHVTDIGGSLRRIGTQEVYEEGLRIPPCKFLVRGEPNTDVFSFIRYNVRVPDMVINDFYAQAGAHRIIQRRIAETLEEFNLDGLDALAEAIFARSEQTMRAAIRELPAGTCRARALTDGYIDPVDIHVAVTVDDGTLTVDYTGSSDECLDGAINSPYACTYSETVAMLHTILLPEVPANHGCFAPFRVVAPEGSIFNARPPRAVNIRTRAVFMADPVIMAAMHAIAPDRVIAAPGQAGGYHAHGHVDGVPFITFFMQSGGMGASARGPGMGCLFFPGTMSTSPVEIIEQQSPLLIDRKRILRGSGGPGQHRGGDGQEIVLTLRPGYEGPVTVPMHPHMLEFPAPGLAGGGPGVVGKIFLNDHRVSKLELNQRGGALVMRGRDRLNIHTPGGGGYGAPGSPPL
ncbi:MAG: hydantoinase B/oxoprolinase family protein [Armatimonadetes bacterium]|nr:hydantoinase B/oxoprolinase family protein [Armatimonadota bacterium]